MKGLEGAMFDGMTRGVCVIYGSEICLWTGCCKFMRFAGFGDPSGLTGLRLFFESQAAPRTQLARLSLLLTLFFRFLRFLCGIV